MQISCNPFLQPGKLGKILSDFFSLPVRWFQPPSPSLFSHFLDSIPPPNSQGHYHIPLHTLPGGEGSQGQMLLLLLDGDSIGPFWRSDLSLPSGFQKIILKNPMYSEKHFHDLIYCTTSVGPF